MKFSWPAGLTISDEPVRQMVGRSSQTVDGYFRTNKRPIRDGDELFVGEAVATVGDSTHEHQFLIFAELDPNVIAIAPQPVWITFEFQGKTARHAPDYAVVLAADDPEIVECKGLRSWRDSNLRDRLSAAARHVESAGWSYNLALDHDMREDPRLEAIDDLWRRHRPTFHPLHELAAADILAKRSEMPIADLMKEMEERMGTAKPAFEQILSLAANGRIFIGLDRPVGRDSLIRYADRAALPERLIPRRRTTDPLPLDEAA